MSSEKLKVLLNKLSDDLTKSTDEYYRKQVIDINTPVIVVLSDTNLNLGMGKLIDEACALIPNADRKKLSKTIFNKFREVFFQNIKNTSPSIEDVLEKIQAYYTGSPSKNYIITKVGTDTLVVYGNNINTYLFTQRRFAKAVKDGVRPYIAQFNEEAADLFANYITVVKKDEKGDSKEVRLLVSNVQAGHIFLQSKSNETATTTPAIKKLDTALKNLEELESNYELFSNQAAASKILSSFKKGIVRAKKGIELKHIKSVKLTARAETILSISELSKNININIVMLNPESREVNLDKSESKILSNMYRNTIVGFFKNSTSLPELETSKNFKTIVEEQVVEALVTGKRKKSYRSKSSAKSKSSKSIKGPKAKEVNNTTTSLSPIKLGVTKKISNKNTELVPTAASTSKTSLSEILTMLQGNIREQVKSNMKTPRLIYRTGRFADSVKISNVTQSSKGLYTITYGYATYPYQTFEPGYEQGSAKRDPRSLIRLSIRELVAKQIGDNFKAVRLGGIGSRGKIE